MSVEVTRLPSGLTVVTDSMPHLQTASLGVWVGSGSRDEQPDEHGISHLLEHMAFKGTKRRTARQIAEEIEAVGGDLNAATSFETTAYYASVLKADMPLAVDVLSDILAESDLRCRPSSSASRTSSCRRSARPRTRPTIWCSTICSRRRFPNQPIGRSILGTPETVCSFKDSNLRAYLGAQLSRARHGGGGDRRGRARARSSPRSSGASASSTARRRRCRSRRRSAAAPSSRRAISSRSTSRSRSKACRSGIADYFSLQVFTIVLGGGMSSRLFQEVREKRGLCYTISAFHAPYADTGMFGIYAGTDAGDVQGADAGRGRRDRGRRRARITEAEVNRAKAQIKVGLLMALESSGARAEQLAQPDPDLRPAAADRGDGRPDRRGDGREHARRRRAR